MNAARPRVYLAGPIAGCTDEEANGWRARATELLSGGYEVLDPMRRDYRGVDDVDPLEIVDADKADIESADFVIAMYPRPSVGTSMEILWAWLDHKPVVLVDASTGPLSPWLRVHATAIARSLQGAITALGLIRDSMAVDE